MRLRSFWQATALLLSLGLPAFGATLQSEFVSPESGTKVVVTLNDTPCKNPKVLVMIDALVEQGTIPAKAKDKFQAGEAVIGIDQHLAFCWTPTQNINPEMKGKILILDENFDGGIMEMAKFAPIASRKDYL